MHYAKYKRGAVGHMLRHYDRTAAGHTSEIDVNRSFDNYNLCTGAGSGLERLRACVGVGGNKGWAKCQQRADVNAMCDWIVTMPKDLPPEYEERFFKAAYNYLANRFGVEGGKNIVSAFVHKDEVTPHMHFAFVPVVADKKRDRYKVSAKEAVTVADLRTIHKSMQQALTHELGVPVNLLNGATKFGNRTVAQLKAVTAAKEASAKEFSAAANELVASVDRRAVHVSATTPSLLGRMLGGEPSPAKVELAPEVYDELKAAAVEGANARLRLACFNNNSSAVEELNERVREQEQLLYDIESQALAQEKEFKKQLAEKDQELVKLKAVARDFTRVVRELGDVAVAKILNKQRYQERQARTSPTTAPKPKAHANTRGSSDYSR